MAIKATLRKAKGPAPTVTTDAPKGTTVDVEATVTTDLEAAVAGEQDAAPEQPANETRALAPRQPAGAVSRYQTQNSEGFDGDWDAIPPKFPQLKLVQGSGKLSKEFNVGTIIFNEVELLPPVNKAKKEAPHRIRFIPMQITLQFREKLSQEAYAEGEVARIANSIAEVEEAGGTTRWYGNTMPDNYWEPSARCLFLIEKPENTDNQSFCLDLDGKQFAIAVYYAAGGAFRAAPKTIRDTAKTSLFVPVLTEDGKPVFNGNMPVKKSLLYKCFWTIEWDMVPKGQFTPYIPSVRLLKEETGPEVRAFISSILSNRAAQEAAAANDADAA